MSHIAPTTGNATSALVHTAVIFLSGRISTNDVNVFTDQQTIVPVMNRIHFLKPTHPTNMPIITTEPHALSSLRATNHVSRCRLCMSWIGRDSRSWCWEASIGIFWLWGVVGWGDVEVKLDGGGVTSTWDTPPKKSVMRARSSGRLNKSLRTPACELILLTSYELN